MSQRTTVLGQIRCCAVLLFYFAQAEAESFSRCHAAVDERPDSYDSALCFYRIATETGDWDAASRAIEDVTQRHLNIPWYRLVQGYVLASTGDTRALTEFEAAATSFANNHELNGELLARANLRIRYFENGNIEKAGDEYRRIGEIGQLTDSAEFKVRALVVEGRHLIDTKSDLNAANAALMKAEAIAEDSLPYFLRREILNELGQLNVTFGSYAKAIDYFRAFRSLADTNNDLTGIALAQANIANTMLELHQVSPAEVEFEVLVAAAGLANASATAAASLPLELFSSRVLAEAHAATNPSVALKLTHDCIERAAQAELFWQKSQCLWIQAFALAQSDPALATQTIDKAIKAMVSTADQDPAQTSFAWRYLMRIHWQTLTREEAISSALRGLDAIESLRAIQSTGHARSSVFSAWNQDYRWLVGRLLTDAASTENAATRADRLSLAVLTGERMRARRLLESIDDPEKQIPTDALQKLAEVISTINRQLFNAPPQRAKQLQNELRDLERQEATLRGVPVASNAGFELSELQAVLGDNEAVLVMHIAEENSSLQLGSDGSWVVAINRNTVRQHPLPSSRFLLRAVTALRSPDKTISEQFAYRLYQRILEPVLEDLPHSIDNLIIVPAASLRSLPFAALSTSPTYSPLAAGKVISIIPSLSTWLRFRTLAKKKLPPRSLVVAQPDLSSYGNEDSNLQVWSGSAPVSLSALPAAKAEADAILGVLPQSQVWLDGKSSELAVKTVNGSDFSVLHFAAHAVIDDVHSEHSALLLAPGSRSEDGLFQVREISQIPLNGQLVVLASCQSALGRDIRGEGVISLTRAFLSAGAGAVIGTLWPVRDDWTALLIEYFYSYLAEGVTAADALARAQTQMHRASYPAESWSAFVLHGDGNWQIDGAVRQNVPTD